MLRVVHYKGGQRVSGTSHSKLSEENMKENANIKHMTKTIKNIHVTTNKKMWETGMTG